MRAPVVLFDIASPANRGCDEDNRSSQIHLSRRRRSLHYACGELRILLFPRRVECMQWDSAHPRIVRAQRTLTYALFLWGLTKYLRFAVALFKSVPSKPSTQEARRIVRGVEPAHPSRSSACSWNHFTRKACARHAHRRLMCSCSQRIKACSEPAITVQQLDVLQSQFRECGVRARC